MKDVPTPDLPYPGLLLARLVCATTLGAGSVLAWAPWSQPWIAPLVYGALYVCLALPGRPAVIAALALAFGLAQHATGHGWIYTALVDKAGLSVPFALLSASIFMLYLASFMALPAYLWARLFLRDGTSTRLPGMVTAAALAALWTTGEWARGHLFNGFSSLSMGYAWLDTPLAGVLPLTGLHGLGLGAYAFCFGWIPAIEQLIRRRPWPAALLSVGLICALVSGQWGRSMPWIAAEGEPMSFRLIQTAVRQKDKFEPTAVPGQIDELTQRIVEEPASLILIPETAFPVFFHQLPAGVIDELSRFSRLHQSHLFVGIARMGSRQEGHNGLLHIRPDSSRLQFLDKALLMPFGEYSPAGFQWFSRRVHFALKDLVPGAPGQQAFVVHSHRIAALICHEDSANWLARRRARDAGVLLNPSNLAWFERSAAIPQGLAMARVRALETGRPILRVANGGVTAHIDHHGEIVAQLPPRDMGNLKGLVQPVQGSTPYSRSGDTPALAACCITFLVASGGRRNRTRGPRTQG